MTDIVFLGGTGRSGTSIIREIFCRHSQIDSLPFESRFVLDPDGIIDFFSTYSESWSPYFAHNRLKRLEALLNDVTAYSAVHGTIDKIITAFDLKKHILPKRYAGWELKQHIPHWEHYVKELMNELVEFTFRGSWFGSDSYTLKPELYYAGPMAKQALAETLGNFLRNVYNSYLAKTGSTLYIEDCTFNILFAKELSELLPESRFLHICRDPRDVVASFSKSKWAPTDRTQSAVYYRALMERMFSVTSAFTKDRYFEFRLEDLVKAPEVIVSDICAFMGVPYESNIIDFDFSKSNTGRWEREYTEQEKTDIQKMLADIIEKLGYELKL